MTATPAALVLALASACAPVAAADGIAPPTVETAIPAFARAATAADAPPAGMLSDDALKRIGLQRADLANATRKLGTTAWARRGVFVVKGTTGACTIVGGRRGTTMGCGPISSLTDPSHPSLGLLADGKGGWNVVGVVVRGVSNATVDGKRLRVSGNVLSGHVTSPPRTITWTNPDGTAIRRRFASAAVPARRHRAPRVLRSDEQIAGSRSGSHRADRSRA